jgi:hypothetical protein
LAPKREQRSPSDADQAAQGHDTATHTDAPNLKVSQHLAVHIGTINAAVLSHLANGQPRGKCHDPFSA